MLLTRLALSAILAAVASCSQPPQLKAALQQQGCSSPDINGFCPITNAGFHFLCGEYSWGEAQQACYVRGLRPAIVSDSQALSALSVIQNCLLLGGERAWIDSFNGLGADPCAYVMADGAAVYSPGDQLCNELRLPVLCQDAPEITSTVSEASVVLVSTSGTSTSLTTTCIQCNCQGNINTIDPVKCPSCFLNKAEKPAPAPLAKAQVRRPHQCHGPKPSSCSYDRPPHCLDPQGCLPLCPYTVGGLHVIQANLTFNQAERECNKYGWNLADTYAGLHADVGFMQQRCGNLNQDYRMWIRSYNGVDGGMCVATLQDDFYNVPIAFGWSADYCMQQPLYVLCQDRPPAITGTGAFAGSVSLTFTTTTYSTTLVVPSTTVTSTITNYY